MRLTLIILMAHIFPDGDGHRRINTGGIDVFLDESETFPEPFLEVRRKIIDSKRHTMVGLRTIIIDGLDLERILMGDDLLDQLNRRVSFAFVFLLLFLRRDHDILQTIHVRLHLDLNVLALLTGFDGKHLGLVADHLEVNGRIADGVRDGKVTVYIGGRTVLGSQRTFAGRLDKINLHERQFFSGIGINHDAGYGCLLSLQRSTDYNKYNTKYYIF